LPDLPNPTEFDAYISDTSPLSFMNGLPATIKETSQVLLERFEVP
jgi:hypothetical protein